MNSANVVLRPLRYFRQVIQSAIFGGQTVVQEFVSDLYPIQLPSSLGLLTFDATWRRPDQRTVKPNKRRSPSYDND